MRRSVPQLLIIIAVIIVRKTMYLILYNNRMNKSNSVQSFSLIGGDFALLIDSSLLV